MLTSNEILNYYKTINPRCNPEFVNAVNEFRVEKIVSNIFNIPTYNIMTLLTTIQTLGEFIMQHNVSEFWAHIFFYDGNFF